MVDINSLNYFKKIARVELFPKREETPLKAYDIKVLGSLHIELVGLMTRVEK